MKNSAATAMTPVEIREAGFDALYDRLGPAGALRFMREFGTGRGDYTKERRRMFRGETLESLGRELRKFSKKFGRHC